MNARLLTWFGVPVGGYLFTHMLIALEEDSSFVALLAALISTALSGGYVRRKGGVVWEAALAGAWFPVLLSAGRVYWRLGLSSPASASQQLVGALGWPYAPAAASLALFLLPTGVFGYYGESLSNSWGAWKRKDS